MGLHTGSENISEGFTRLAKAAIVDALSQILLPMFLQKSELELNLAEEFKNGLNS